MMVGGNGKRPASFVETSTVKRFSDQVGGHGRILHTADSKMVFKPLIEREHVFYEQASKYPLLKPFFPEYYGTLELNRDASESTEPLEKPIESFICLENLVYGFESPCIMDIKIGTRLHDIDAKPEKAARMKAKASQRTHWNLGFAVEGMSCPGRPAYNREWAIGLTTETIVSEALAPFFAVAESVVSAEYRRFIIEQFVAEISEYRDAIRSSETRMYSSSLLLAYDACKGRYARFLDKSSPDSKRADGNDSGDKDSNGDGDSDDGQAPENAEALFDMRAIDFAHSHWVPGQGSDEQYLFGLDSLLSVLQRLFE